MTHQDEGHYAAKHPADTHLDPQIADRIEASGQEKTLSCRKAHEIAAQLKCTPSAVGVALDLMEYRLVRCQLGLFGHGSKKITPADHVADALAHKIRDELVSGRLACDRSWRLAEEMGLSKKKLAAACETLEIKIAPCQLGAF